MYLVSGEICPICTSFQEADVLYVPRFRRKMSYMYLVSGERCPIWIVAVICTSVEYIIFRLYHDRWKTSWHPSEDDGSVLDPMLWYIYMARPWISAKGYLNYRWKRSVRPKNHFGATYKYVQGPYIYIYHTRRYQPIQDHFWGNRMKRKQSPQKLYRCPHNRSTTHSKTYVDALCDHVVSISFDWYWF